MKSIRVILFDDNSRVRDSVTMLLSAIPGLEFAGAFPDCGNLEHDIMEAKPDVVLMDIDMPGKDGVEAVKDIRKLDPEIKILMQTVFDDTDKIFSAICNGAHGYLLKNTPPLKIIESIQDVYQGGAPMTPEVASKVLKMLATNQTVSDNDYKLSVREKDVLRLLVDGKSYKMIGSDLSITYDTVRAHIKKIYEKLHVSSMTEAVAKAIHHRIV